MKKLIAIIEDELTFATASMLKDIKDDVVLIGAGDKLIKKIEPPVEIQMPFIQGQKSFNRIPVVRQGKKPKRNSLCYCGSGKKYKHCHLK